MMLASCRDVLGVEQAALYLRSLSEKPFQLIAAEGGERIPFQLEPHDEIVSGLSDGGSVQRVIPETRSELSSLQRLLRELRAGLIHPLEADWGLAGLVVLGEKKGGAPFTAEDLTFLHALGQITNVAFHSAKVDLEIVRLNEELQLKLEKISAQKRQIDVLQAELAHREPAAAEPAVPSGDGFRRDVIRGSSPAILSVLDTVRKVATSESSVLIRGESGTGKELLARVLHDNSPRRAGPMVAVHCASLSPTLLESELFGHVRGSFTGAERDRIGRFEMANGGTLFLDEIGDISLETQVKPLRVLQERCFEPVGGTRTVHVDVRLVTATHQDLEKLIVEGRFREDLYYRLNVISITLPPLRERMEDIYELAIHFLRKSTQRVGKRILDIDSDAFAVLERHYWPGNIRELENVIERAVVLAETEQITLRDLPAETTRALSTPGYAFDAKPFPLRGGGSADRFDGRRLDPAAERQQLQMALAQCGGNKAEAARKLGMPRSTYYSKLKKYEID
jgi:transcriptional regulator with GAF, ATPase, and Fis domain